MYIKYLIKGFAIIIISLIGLSCVTIKVCECNHDPTEIESSSNGYNTDGVLFNFDTSPLLRDSSTFNLRDIDIFLPKNRFYYPRDTVNLLDSFFNSTLLSSDTSNLFKYRYDD